MPGSSGLTTRVTTLDGKTITLSYDPPPSSPGVDVRTPPGEESKEPKKGAKVNAVLARVLRGDHKGSQTSVVAQEFNFNLTIRWGARRLGETDRGVRGPDAPMRQMRHV